MFLKLIVNPYGDGQRIKISWVAEVRGAATVTDEVVVVEGIEVDIEMIVQFEAETYSTDEARAEADIFTREFTYFVKIVKIDEIICHPVGFTNSTF